MSISLKSQKANFLGFLVRSALCFHSSPSFRKVRSAVTSVSRTSSLKGPFTSVSRIASSFAMFCMLRIDFESVCARACMRSFSLASASASGWSSGVARTKTSSWLAYIGIAPRGSCRSPFTVPPIVGSTLLSTISSDVFRTIDSARPTIAAYSGLAIKPCNAT